MCKMCNLSDVTKVLYALEIFLILGNETIILIRLVIVFQIYTA